MKAKKKPIDTVEASSYGVDLAPRLEVVTVTAPPEREPGVIVANAAELIDKLKNEAGHDNSALNANTLNTLNAAEKIGGDITVLVAGSDAQSVVDEASAIGSVSKVLSANNPALADGLAENIAWLVNGIAANYYSRIGAGF
ncbi:Electron transfer flavoprotein subunit beta [Nymphon striatum]|nr:Electron transfer flavoprotein subunit beta [Nymphon striatum]